METIKPTNRKNATYENFEAECPYCLHYNIYNRATDLNTFEPISFREVECYNPNCKKIFKLSFDFINPAFEMLIFDCYELIERKKYMACILNLTQSIELFINTFLRVQLIYKLATYSEDIEDKTLVDISEIFYSTIKEYSYTHLRNVFIHWFINNFTSTDFNKSIEILNSFSNYTKTPPFNELKNITDPEIYNLLSMLYNCKINETRNKIIHSDAYRPNLSEANYFLEEVSNIIFGLKRRLGILSSNINFYLNS